MQALEKKLFCNLWKTWQGFSPSKSRNFITDLCSSSLEPMVALKPILFKWSKLRVYTLVIEKKNIVVICVGSCTWKDGSMKSPDIFWSPLV